MIIISIIEKLLLLLVLTPNIIYIPELITLQLFISTYL